MILWPYKSAFSLTGMVHMSALGDKFTHATQLPRVLPGYLLLGRSGIIFSKGSELIRVIVCTWFNDPLTFLRFSFKDSSLIATP